MKANWTIDGVREALAAKKIFGAGGWRRIFARRLKRRNPEAERIPGAFARACAEAGGNRIDALVASESRLPPLAGVPVRD